MSEVHPYEGIKPPCYCPRGIGGCIALSQIIAENHESYICVGGNDGSDRAVEQDEFTLCVVNSEVDRRENLDLRDLIHEASVISMAVATVIEDTS